MQFTKAKVIGILTVVALLFVFLFSYTRVPQGFVGVQFNKFGSDKGVQMKVLNPGSYFLTPNQSVELFPTYVDTYTWKDDEAVAFQDKDGLSVSSAVSITYKVNPAKAATLFQEYRRGIDDIRAKQLRDLVVDAVGRTASSQSIVDIVGPGKVNFITAVEKSVRDQVAPLGIVVNKVTIVGVAELPDQVKRAIDAKITATQKAIARQNEVAEAKAAADKEIERARGIKESSIAVAEGRARAMDLEGQALARNPNLVNLRYVEKWDGKLPQYQMGDATPLVNLK